MKRLLLAGAAFAALTGFAVAQSSMDAAPPPPAQAESPSVVITPPPPPADADDTAAGSEAMGQPPMMERMRGEGGDRRAAKEQGRGPGAKWRHGDMGAKMDGDDDDDMDRSKGWRMNRHMAGAMGHHGRRHGRGDLHHGRGFGSPGDEGARFTFERPGKGKIDIRCASEDSTQECVDAVLPMLQDLLREGAGASRTQ